MTIDIKEESRYNKYFMAGIVSLTIIIGNAMGFDKGYEYGSKGIAYEDFYREPPTERAIKKAVMGAGYYLGHAAGSYDLEHS
jgi:hypothetical protein